MTGNDLALAQASVQMALHWHKKQPNNDFSKQQIARLYDLNAKLDRLLDEHSAVVDNTDGECEFAVVRFLPNPANPLDARPGRS